MATPDVAMIKAAEAQARGIEKIGKNLETLDKTMRVMSNQMAVLSGQIRDYVRVSEETRQRDESDRLQRREAFNQFFNASTVKEETDVEGSPPA